MNPVVSCEQARSDAARLLRAAGLDAEKAGAVADKLVESDLLSHRTHGLAQLPTYLERLANRQIATEGDIDVVSDTGATFAWTAHRLPGAWVMDRAIAQALDRIGTQPVVTVTIAECSHIGCLQAYLEAIGRRKLMALLMVTDPGVASVAPFGGIDPVLTSNPIAACIPTLGDPILIDQTTSVVSNGAIAQHAGGRLPGRWLLDAEGRATDDPAALKGGTIMPLGGEEFGFKGYGFGLMVEAFALALSGYARNETRLRGGQGVFLQIIDPAHFAGRDAFLAATTDLADRCRNSRPAAGRPVRLPGERALRDKATQLESGIAVDERVREQLDAWTARLGLAAPAG